MSIKIAKWSLITPSLIVIAMALGLSTTYGVDDIFTQVLHIAQFFLIILTLIMMNKTYLKLFSLYNNKGAIPSEGKHL